MCPLVWWEFFIVNACPLSVFYSFFGQLIKFVCCALLLEGESFFIVNACPLLILSFVCFSFYFFGQLIRFACCALLLVGTSLLSMHVHFWFFHLFSFLFSFLFRQLIRLVCCALHSLLSMHVHFWFFCSFASFEFFQTALWSWSFCELLWGRLESFPCQNCHGMSVCDIVLFSSRTRGRHKCCILYI